MHTYDTQFIVYYSYISLVDVGELILATSVDIQNVKLKIEDWSFQTLVDGRLIKPAINCFGKSPESRDEAMETLT